MLTLVIIDKTHGQCFKNTYFQAPHVPYFVTGFNIARRVSNILACMDIQISTRIMNSCFQLNNTYDEKHLSHIYYGSLKLILQFRKGKSVVWEIELPFEASSWLTWTSIIKAALLVALR